MYSSLTTRIVGIEVLGRIRTPEHLHRKQVYKDMHPGSLLFYVICDL